MLFLLTVLLTLLGLGTSAANYPGGEAMRWAHHHYPASPKIMHIDVAPAMTGVSLFQSLRHSSHLEGSKGAFGIPFLPSVLPDQQQHANAEAWVYDKSEDLPRSTSAPNAAVWNAFDLLLSEVPCNRVLVDPSEPREMGDEQSPFALAQSQDGEEPIFSEHAGLALKRGPLAAKVRREAAHDKRGRGILEFVQQVVLPRLPALAGYRLAFVTIEEAANEPYVRTEALALVRGGAGQVVEGKVVKVVLAAGVKRRQRVWVCERVR